MSRQNHRPVPAITPEVSSVPAAGREYLPWGGGGGPWQGAGPGIDWRRHLSRLYRHRWLILLVTVLGAVAGFGVTQFVSPLYRAEATLWVEHAEPGARTAGPVGGSQLLRDFAWLDLLESYPVLDRVVRHLGMYVRPASVKDTVLFRGFAVDEQFRPGVYRLAVDASGAGYVLVDEEGRAVDGGAVGDSIGVGIGFRWQPDAVLLTPGRTTEFRVLGLRDAATELREALDTQTEVETNFLALRLTGSDPRRITRIVNAVAEEYVAVAERLKRRKHTELTAILGEQLDSADQRLSQAEEELERFQRLDAASPSAAADEPGDRIVEEYLDRRLTRDGVRRDREAIARILNSRDEDGLSVAALEMIGAVQQSSALSGALADYTDKRAELRALRLQYTDVHPSVQRAAEQVRTLEEQSIPQLARELMAQLTQRERSLGDWVAETQQELRTVPERRLEAARLERQVALADEMFTTVKRRYDEARLAEASSVPDVRILSAAAPPQTPVQNTAPRIMLIAVFGSFGTALLGVLLHGRFDRRVFFPEQVSLEMGLPILGALPHIRGRDKSLQPQEMAEHVEALRGIRLNLVHAYGAPPPLLFTITSPSSGDGKSFVASRLALAFADAGYRTLLIDGDVRRGRLHYTLGRRRRPGLIDHLEGSSAVTDIVQSTGFGPLDFIAAGRRSKAGPELLSSRALQDLFATLRAQYEVVLIDSAPMAAAVDPLVLGTATGNLVLVLRSGITDGEMASAKLDALDRLPIRVIGAIMNDVHPSDGYQLYSYYLPGYEAEDEGESRGLPAAR